MKKLSEFFIELIVVFLFCVAIKIAFMQFQSLSKSYQWIKRYVVEEEVLYENNQKIDTRRIEYEVVSKESLVIMLVSKFSYPIQLDKTMYFPETFDYATFDFSTLESFYQKEYSYKEDGSIQWIQYKKMEK